MSLKRTHSPTPPTAKPTHETWISTKIEDRTSIFLAHFSPTMPPKTLQSQPSLRSASHRMLAWRTPSTQRTLSPHSKPSHTLQSGSDDDGEKYGGRRALKVLEEMRVEGAVVVARWYGGVMLGPVRFTHIEDVVRDAVRAWRQGEDSEEGKVRRVLEEERVRRELVEELRERDASIRVLRELLESKTRIEGKDEGDGVVATRPSIQSVREIDYGTLTLERLRQMDKARDSTIAFLLKRIDEIEKKEAAASSGGDKAEEQQASVTSNDSKVEDLREKEAPLGPDKAKTESEPTRPSVARNPEFAGPSNTSITGSPTSNPG